MPYLCLCPHSPSKHKYLHNILRVDYHMTCMLTDRNQAKQNKFPFDKGQNNCFTKCSLHFIYNLF